MLELGAAPIGHPLQCPGSAAVRSGASCLPGCSCLRLGPCFGAAGLGCSLHRSPGMLPAQPRRGAGFCHDRAHGKRSAPSRLSPSACGFPSPSTEAVVLLHQLGGFGPPLAGEMQHLSGFPLNLFLPSVTSPAWCSWVPSSTGAVWLNPAALQGPGMEQSHQPPVLQHPAGLRAWMRGWVPALQSFIPTSHAAGYRRSPTPLLAPSGSGAVRVCTHTRMCFFGT